MRLLQVVAQRQSAEGERMTDLLDSQGRKTEVLWRAKALASWLHDPKLRRVISQTVSKPMFSAIQLSLVAYFQPGIERVGVENLEPQIETHWKLVLGNRIVRRAIANHMLKSEAFKGVPRAEAMAALKRQGID